MKHLNSLITPEMFNIKRDDVFDAVHIHRRYKPGIVDVEAGHSIGGDQALPFRAISTAPNSPYVGIHVDGGFVSNVNTKPAERPVP